jgi:hypothetical protein
VTKPRPRRERVEEIDGVSWRYLNDATTDQDRAEEGWLLDTLEFNLLPAADAIESNRGIPVVDPPTGKSTEQLWADYGRDIVKWWINDQPGTRPRCWWRFSAPEPRRRLGGTGVTREEVWGRPDYMPDFQLPASDSWLTREGKRWHPFADDPLAVPVDPKDPPTFESQAAYLKRLGLLLPGEENRLAPDAFTPERIEPDPQHSWDVGFHS